MRTPLVFLVVMALGSSTLVNAQATVPDGQTGVVPATEQSAYRLGPGDVLDIKFLLNSELNEQVQVRPDGFIAMPLVGELSVAGLTVSDLVSKLTKAFETVLKSPSVIVQVREFANRRVFVGGEVGRPGVLPLIGRQTALGAVMEAGGLKSSANRDGIVVLRRGDEDTPRVIHLSMKSADGTAPEASAFQLQPLDVVFVNESGVSRANRAVDQYVRQMSPMLLTAGFSYLFHAALFGAR
jgi:protein involved in polysaccharide export with SLBB domain